MAFKGTKRRSALQIAEEIEDVGGYINAYTSREVTAYYARVLKDDVPLALDVIGRYPAQSGLRPARDRGGARGVILQEIGQSLDTPDDVIFRLAAGGKLPRISPSAGPFWGLPSACAVL